MFLSDFRDKHKGETCVVIGNGPSLDDTPLGKLGAKYLTFGSNKIYTYPFCPDYYVCVDHDMLHDCIEWLTVNPEYSPSAKFLPRYMPYPGASGLTVIPETGWSQDIEKGVYLGGTVTMVAFQLACYMGFETVLTVGLDHEYKKTAHDGKPGSKFVASGDDPDHFGSEYFTPGKIYNRPELAAVEKYSYPLANMNLNIVNISAFSALAVFKRDKAENWI